MRPAGVPTSELTVSRVATSFRTAIEAEYGLVRRTLQKGSKRFGGRGQAGPISSEKERQAMELYVYMLAIALSLTASETARLVGIAVSTVCAYARRAQDRLRSGDADLAARYDAVRDRVRSLYWYTRHAAGLNLIPQVWALRMHESLAALSKMPLPPAAADVVQKALVPPWQTVEMIPPAAGVDFTFRGERPPAEVTPLEPMQASA